MAKRSLQHLCVILLAGAAVFSSPAAASAAPATQLPDADLWCGPGYRYEVHTFIGLSPSASQWVEDPVYGGHYVLRTVSHYLADGLLQGPVADPSGLLLLSAKTYGAATGQAKPIACQVVSRFADQQLTVIAPVTMSRVP